MKTSEKIQTIAPALLKAQQVIEGAKKNARNPHFDYEYADMTQVIAAVKKALNDNGVFIMQGLGHNDNGPMVETRLLHSSGEYIATETPIYCGKPNDPQAYGSGSTYAKRYALQALLALPTEDDDANSAQPNGGQSKQRQRQKPPVNYKDMDSDESRKFILEFSTADAFIKKVESKYNVTEQDKGKLRAIFGRIHANT